MFRIRTMRILKNRSATCLIGSRGSIPSPLFMPLNIFRTQWQCRTMVRRFFRPRKVPQFFGHWTSRAGHSCVFEIFWRSGLPIMSAPRSGSGMERWRRHTPHWCTSSFLAGRCRSDTGCGIRLKTTLSCTCWNCSFISVRRKSVSHGVSAAGSISFRKPLRKRTTATV